MSEPNNVKDESASTSRADAGGGRAELRRAIMGLAYPDVAAHVCELGPVSAYRLGYKDARYDAAELVLSSPPVDDQGVREAPATQAKKEER